MVPNSIKFILRDTLLMIYVGIDVAKDKHDCFIMSSEGEVLHDVFTVPNSMTGFDDLFQKISLASVDLGKVKAGLEATGHYSYNLLGFLLGKFKSYSAEHPPE